MAERDHLEADRELDRTAMLSVVSAAPRARHPLELPSRESQETLAEVRRLALHDSVPVCLVGPSGTGKSLYAKEIHARSPRRAGPYVHVNLASLPKQLSASELMGYVPGAFTGAVGRRVGRFASANGGTLILDELTKSTRAVQHLLLDLVDRAPHIHLGSDREVSLNLRLVALTSTPLDEARRCGALIPDLFERLKPFVVEIAPLSARTADIEALVQSMVLTHGPAFGYASPPRVHPCLLPMISRRPLTGNHRELEGLVLRLLVNAEGASLLTPRHLPRDSQVTATRSLRSKRARYDAYQASGDAPHFDAVKDEAAYYEVSIATIYRWRGDPPRAAGASIPSVASPSRD